MWLLCVLLLCPLRVLLLWAILFPGTGNVLSVQEEIFTRPGSDLLLPIRRHLTLIPTDTRRCDWIEWKYKEPPRHTDTRIFTHKGCTLRKYENAFFSNMKISENGSLIISNVTPENAGIYSVNIYGVIIYSMGYIIQRDNYSVHVEDPVSDPVLDVRCLQNNSTEISCEVKNGTDLSIFLTVSGQLMIYNVTSSERTVRVTVPPVSPPNSWNIRCSAKNLISERSTNQTHDACPEGSRSGMWSGWGHLLSHGVMCVLNTALLIYIVTGLRKMKNEKNLSERRTRRRDQTEMEMKPTYSN